MTRPRSDRDPAGAVHAAGTVDSAGAVEPVDGAVPMDTDEVWPGVADPAALLVAVADWLSGYGNVRTRRTYAEGLGLPVSAADLEHWTTGVERSWVEAVASYVAAVQLRPPEPGAERSGPPPAPRGRLRSLHWFRWCAARRLDPVRATTRDVQAWLDAVTAAGAAPATRDRLLATVKTLYAHVADTGLADGNPAALSRRRLGLSAASTSATSTVTLTASQVRALHAAAAAPRRGASALDVARSGAVVALFTLGLRVSELCELDESDLHVTRGRRALRVTGKGGKTRIVYLSAPADAAITAYRAQVRETQRSTTTRAEPVPADAANRTAAAPERPLLRTRTGRRFQRQAIWQLLRRVAASAGPELADVADALHPHALRHFYVTTAVEAGADLAHVQGDVGHSSIDTTRKVYDHAAPDPERSAVDLVADAWYED
ncbi:integrase [Saccharomonospora sp. CUA-673]|uniref:tyrosine-type recombinase/integrase n=1 Tax=Saccharomonospora sp. CUA-673 TaxID=1904969 RepID=UPI00096235B0|nr:tyrosine-type recombinase/integrase [Saccharomonospora sp. CUA-673]OLT46689.1 integrase [Saccharomonospora sp. CUA-673]